MEVPFEYGLGDEVIVKDIGRPAKVRACSMSERGLEYQITFWSEGDRHLMWVYTDELERKKQ